MSEAIQEAYAYADHNITIYETLELTHTSFVPSIKLVDSPHILVVTQGSFQPVNFEVTLPETESSVRGQMKVSIRFLLMAYRELLYASSKTSDPVYMYYRQYISGDSDPQAELPVALTINTMEFTDELVVLNALYPDLMNINICRRLMTARELPGCQI